MDSFIRKEDNYLRILEALCKLKGIDMAELSQILKDRECKYLLFLLLKKYKCDDIEALHRDFSIESRKTVSYGLKKAEEKFFINKEFRDMYFELEKEIKKSSV